MDVAFREDYTRKTDNAAINFSALGKMALMMLKAWDKKVGIASKRKFVHRWERHLFSHA